MKVLLFAMALLAIPVGCAADNYRYRHHGDSHYHAHSFWHQVERRLAHQHLLIEEGLEHGRLNPHQAQKLSRKLCRLEDYISDLRDHNRWGGRHKQNILNRLDRNHQAIERHLHRNRPHHRDNRRTYGTDYNRRSNIYLNNNGIRWSGGNSFGGFYFRF